MCWPIPVETASPQYRPERFQQGLCCNFPPDEKTCKPSKPTILYQAACLRPAPEHGAQRSRGPTAYGFGLQVQRTRPQIRGTKPWNRCQVISYFLERICRHRRYPTSERKCPERTASLVTKCMGIWLRSSYTRQWCCYRNMTSRGKASICGGGARDQGQPTGHRDDLCRVPIFFCVTRQAFEGPSSVLVAWWVFFNCFVGAPVGLSCVFVLEWWDRGSCEPE